MPELKSAGVTLDKIFGPMKEEGVDAEILLGIKIYSIPFLHNLVYVANHILERNLSNCYQT